MRWALSVALLLFGCAESGGQVVTLAGSGAEGDSDGSGSDAAFNKPLGLCVDNGGNVYVADSANHSIRRVRPTGETSTLAGGERGYADGVGDDAQFYLPTGLACDGRGNLYVADSQNHLVRHVEIATGMVTTVAGQAGRSGFVDGAGPEARFNSPSDLAIDGTGDRLWVVDKLNHAIRRIDLTTAAVSTIAGSGEAGSDDGAARDARFMAPTALAVDGGSVWVTDTGNHTIRQLGADGVRTVAGLAQRGGYANGPVGESRLNWPWGIARFASGTVVFAEAANGTIRSIVDGVVREIAGSAQSAGPPKDGSLSKAVLASPSGVAVTSSGDLYFTDRHSVRVIRGLDLE